MKKLGLSSKYVITTYITFWLMVLVICGGASMVFHASPVVMRILSNVCAWSPTIVLLSMFKSLKPETKRIAFIKEKFSGKLNVFLLVLPPVVLAGGTFLSAWILSLVEKKDFSSLFSLGSYSFIASFFFSILSGPTGEELGWRGFLRDELGKKYSFIKASIIQGVIWAFWHTVLWFVDSDFTGLEIIPYVLSNVIVMTCIVIAMNVVLEKSCNLLYTILMHFAFNFVYCFLKVDITFYVILSVVYILIAALFLLYRKISNKAITRS